MVIASAPGLLLDNFLPIPNAESLPFYLSVLKLVVCDCCVQDDVQKEVKTYSLPRETGDKQHCALR